MDDWHECSLFCEKLHHMLINLFGKAWIASIQQLIHFSIFTFVKPLAKLLFDGSMYVTKRNFLLL